MMPNIRKLKKKKQPSEYDKAMRLAKRGKFESAIEALRPLTRKGKYKEQAKCNIGVCYERLGDYKNAKKYYSASNDNVSKHNLLALFDNYLVEFTNDEYFEACIYLIKRHSQIGYLYMSYIYQNDKRGIENKNKAFQVLLTGFENCYPYDRLTFEIAYLLEKGWGCKEDHFKSHILYSTILNKDNVVAKYNYAEQCLFGWGCKKDIKLAINYFSLAADKGYRDAIKYLIKIYSDKESQCFDESLKQHWENELEKIGGE